MVCSNAFFATTTKFSGIPLNLTSISEKRDEKNNKITFDYVLNDHISYIGVKAVTSEG